MRYLACQLRLSRSFRLQPRTVFKRLIHEDTVYPRDLSALRDRINAITTDLDEKSTIRVLRACSKLESDLITQSDPSNAPENVRSILKGLLKSGHVRVTQNVLSEYFLSPSDSSSSSGCCPSSTTALMIIDRFNKDNTTNKSDGHIPRNIAMIPFRQAAYHAEFDNALEIIDKTVGSQSTYQRHVSKKIRQFWSTWALATSSIVGGVHVMLQSGLIGDWSTVPMAMGQATIPMMVFTYVTSLTLYGILSMSGRLSKSGDILEWSKGTRTSYRYRHAVEMQMASLLAQVNMSLRENQGECSLHLIKQLQKRSMDVIVPEQEELLREYWVRGGEGFEWIEPDQDPADVIWREKMERASPSRIGSPYSRAHSSDGGQWTDQVLNTIPHASLIQRPSAPELPGST